MVILAYVWAVAVGLLGVLFPRPLYRLSMKFPGRHATPEQIRFWGVFWLVLLATLWYFKW